MRRKEIDEDKLALAFLMLARELHQQTQTDACDERGKTSEEDETAAGGRPAS